MELSDLVEALPQAPRHLGDLGPTLTRAHEVVELRYRSQFKFVVLNRKKCDEFSESGLGGASEKAHGGRRRQKLTYQHGALRLLFVDNTHQYQTLVRQFRYS